MNAANVIPEDVFDILDKTTALRDHVLDTLSDVDLGYSLPGNPTLGAQLRQMGEYQQDYINSIKSRKLIFGYKYEDAEAVETSVEKLKAWSAQLNNDFKAAFREEGENSEPVMIDRVGEFVVPMVTQLHIFRECLLIYYGRLDVYLRAMDKPVSQQWKNWIG